MQKRINSQNQVSSDDVAAQLTATLIAKLKSSSVKELNLTLKKLNYVCENFDPFDFLNQDTETENILVEFELNQFETNPFDFTKVVLQLIDTIESLKNNSNKRVH